jgi:hypothetical protein
MTRIAAIFGVYIITAVITGSSLFAAARAWIVRRTPRLRPVPEHPHFIECRLCLGFWVSLGITLVLNLPWTDLLLIYGGSYFLATQER